MSARLLAAAAVVAVAGCTAVAPPPAQPSPPPAPERPGSLRLACDGGETLSLRLLGDEVHLNGVASGTLVLLRDAGGVTPQQAVFSKPGWRLELGLGLDGRDAVLNQLEPAPRLLRCRRP